ncbi:MAG TPA: hypothetical protein VLG50_00295 [Candidatus Saccharimonadales bacterium]|nr:hypothetical protein [Candidatus Saccharimonadales bacterium]
MNNQKFQSFIDLVTFDQSLSELEKKLNNIETTIQSLNNQQTHLEKQLEQNSLKKRDIKKQLDAQALLVKELQDKEKHQQEVMQDVSSAKELDAANKEFEYLKLERNAQEQKMLQHILKLEIAEKEYDALQLAFQAEVAKVNEQIHTQQQALEQTQQDVEKLVKDRDQFLKNVPADWMDVYENMRGRVANPVVAVQQDSCSVCFSLISSRDLQALKHNELLQCKDCYRFLYYEDKK